MKTETNRVAGAVGTITIDELGMVAAFDAVAVRLFGYSADDVVGKNVSMLMPQPYHSEHDGYLARYKETATPRVIGKGREVTGRRKDHSTFPVWLAINEVNFGSKRLFVGSIVDLTEQKATEADLAGSLEMTRAILDTAVNPIITIDAAGLMRSFNPAAERLFGYMPGEVIGRNIKCLMPQPYRAEHDDYLARYLREGKPRVIGIGREVTAQRKNGSTVPIHLSVGAMTVGGERMFVGIISDISDQKRRETELLQAKEEAEAGARAKTVFLANMSHEIRTPMNAVIGFAEVVLQDKNLTAKTAKHVRTIRSSAGSLLSIINDVLDVSKLESGKFQMEQIAFHLPNALADVIEVMQLRAEEKRLAIELVLDADLPVRVKGDPSRLRQIVLNLLSNSIKFTEQGNIKILVQAVDESNMLCFSITDTGIGMAPSRVEKVFEPFAQEDDSTSRRFGGTGLGMTICKQMIELMGGRIWIESELGRGTKVLFTVPLSAADPADHCLYEIGSGLAERYVSPRLFDVLLVEDIENNAYLVSLRLEQMGHGVRWVQNGREAVEAHQKHDFDIILMDVMMPVMDGIAATSAIRKLESATQRRVPILALTANVMREDEVKCMAAGMDGMAAKPMDLDALLATMERLVPPGLGKPANAAVTETLSDAVIDFSPLESVADHRQGLNRWGDANAYFKALTAFARDRTGDADVIRHLLAQYSENSEPARTVAHALKGLAGNLSLMAVGDLADQIDTYLKTGHRHQAEVLLVLLRHSLLATQRSIYALRSVVDDTTHTVRTFDPSAVANLLQQLQVALDELNPDSAEPILNRLTKYVSRADLANIRRHIELFDFHTAKKESEKFAKRLLATLDETS